MGATTHRHPGLFCLMLTCLACIAGGTAPLLAAQTKTVTLTPAIPARVLSSGQTLAAPQTRAQERTTPPVTPQVAQATRPVSTNARLQKLLQLTFDRRPEAYFAAWSEPSRQIEVELADDDRPPRAYNKRQKLAAEMRASDEEARHFARAVTLGQWKQVGQYLADLPTDDAQKVYDHLLQSLLSTPAPEQQAMTMVNGQPVAVAVPNATGIAVGNLITPDDVLALSDAAPGDVLSPTQLEALARLTALASQQGNSLDSFQQRLRAGTRWFGGDAPEARLRAARLLISAGKSDLAGEYLPESDSLGAGELEIVASYHAQRYAQQGKPEQLEQAWQVNQRLLARDELDAAAGAAALRRALELSGKVRAELGEAWLASSFTESPQRGMQILAHLGSAASQNLVSQYQQPAQREQTLRLQNSTVESLLEVAPSLAQQWQTVLTVLAQGWLKEAEMALQLAPISSRGPVLRLDVYGNYYYADEQDPYVQAMRSRPDQPRPIGIGELLAQRPSDRWIAIVDPSLQHSFLSALVKLHLRVDEEDQAFPLIEQIAVSHPQEARLLVHEFLQAWTRNHDPNSDRNMRNRYIYVYGYDVKADSIPLTRSKQQRNLAELKVWVERIRQLPIEPVDEQLLARAFTTCHSTAEVYRLEAFEAVFGSIDSLQPATVAEMAQTMRSRLASLWRDVRTQEAQQTRRKAPEVQQEVVRGYEVARQLASRALEATPDSWQLTLSLACVVFDENAYEQTVQKSSQFSQRRDRAFQIFQQAADLYAQQVVSLEQAKQSTDVFDYWFYAALGACDLGRVDHETVPDLRQFARIRQAIDALPGEAAEFHLAQFANNLFTRMSPVQPQVKFRYLRAGFEIAGDHPRAVEARRVYEYYRDLVREIQLVAEIDGSDVVGHGQPFGLFVNLLHTADIERESGGFGKYVQNQNQLTYAYNYGRPTEDYRDKFQEATSKALGEHFEVISVTFENPKTIKSRPHDDGWRITPYAYVLLRPRGPEVDKIPPLTLDLDFLDTSGYTIIPFQSPAIPIDAADVAGEPRPMRDLKVVQTLDERQAGEGKLILEIKATAIGLVPPIEQIVGLNVPSFRVQSIDDQSVLPTEYVADSDQILIQSDRSWTVQYAVDPGIQSPPGEFQFCSPLLDSVQMLYQRYDDADLVEVARIVPLEKHYASAARGWLQWLLIGLGAFALAVVGGVAVLRIRPRRSVARYQMPPDVNPFTIIGLLRQIRRDPSLPGGEREELGRRIKELEAHYFGRTNGQADPDLQQLAQRWLQRVR